MAAIPIRHHRHITCYSIMALTFLSVFITASLLKAETEHPLQYVVDIRHPRLTPKQVDKLLWEVSRTTYHKDDPPESVALLERRAQSDIPEMKRVLRSSGYFLGNVTATVIPPEKGFKIDPDAVERVPDADTPQKRFYTVRFDVKPGPRFSLSHPLIVLAPNHPPDTLEPPTPAQAGVPKNSLYAARKILEAGQYILKHYRQNGYPFPEMIERTVTADMAAHTVHVRFEVAPGPKAVFGQTRIEGLKGLDPAYVRALLTWKTGQAYDVRRIESTRRTLFDTNLFSLVEFDNPDELTDKDRLPITVRLKERAPRTIRAAVEYTTDFGPGVSGSWTHRNLFNMAEKFIAGAVFNSKIRRASIRFEKPMFMDKTNTLIADGAFNDETTDAYDARSADTTGVLERQFTRRFKAGAGLGFRYGRVKQKSNNLKSTYRLAYLPVTANQDTRTSLINPTHGYNLILDMAPYQDIRDGDTRFFRYLLSGSTYYNFNSGDRVVVAVRAAFGQIFGIRHDAMPADLRFYAGGGGSVRGYAYQAAGPVQGDIPLGGLSVLTFSLELRFRITDAVGLVPFLDGGTAFLDRVPNFDKQDLLYGVGLGLRYYTTIGPIRLDVAFPVNRRKGVDDRFQIYVSIGQAF